jgi:predicted ester cyclase
VALRTRLTGTTGGPVMGQSATGNKVELEEMQIRRVVDGKVAEHWRSADSADLTRQVGRPPRAGVPEEGRPL